MKMSRVNYYDVNNGRRVAQDGEETSSIFTTSSSATARQPKRRPFFQGMDSVNTFISSTTFPVAVIQSNSFHVIRFFFCILQMLMILALIIVIVVGIRYSYIYRDITNCKEQGKEYQEPDQDDIDNHEKDEVDDYYQDPKIYHNHSPEYLFKLKLSVILLFAMVGVGGLQQIFGWLTLMKLNKRMMIICLFLDISIISLLYVFDTKRVDSAIALVISISLLTILNCLLLLYMIFTLKTPLPSLLLQMSESDSSTKRKSSWIKSIC